jgi:hypothetical protein
MPTLTPASLGLRASAMACPGRPEYIRRVRGGMRRRLTDDSRSGPHKSRGAQAPHECNHVNLIKALPGWPSSNTPVYRQFRPESGISTMAWRSQMMIESAGGRASDDNRERTHRHLVAVAVAQLIEFPVGGGQSTFVEAEDSAAGVVTRGIGTRSIATRASQTFEEAISRVRPVTEAIVAQMRKLPLPEFACHLGRNRLSSRKLSADEL